MSTHVNFRKLLFCILFSIGMVGSFFVSMLFATSFSDPLLGVPAFLILLVALSATIFKSTDTIYNAKYEWFQQGEYQEDPRCARR